MRSRPLTARGQRNTELMLDASTRVLADPGWRGFNLHRVAQTMGLSQQPVRSRADSRESLAAYTWETRLAEPLLAALDSVLAATTEDALVLALRPFLNPSHTSNATGELLILACFDPAIRDAVASSLGDYLRKRLSTSDEAAARTAFTISLALGLLFIHRHPDADSWRLDDAIRTRARALQQRRVSHGVPDVAAPHMDEDPELAPGDPALQALLASCLRLVSMRGYDNVTVRQIARESGSTEGLIYARYRGKQDMFLDAVRRQQQAGWALNDAFVMRLENDHGPAIAEAIQWQQWQKPQRALARAMVLEQQRMTWHDAQLMASWAGELAAFRATLLSRPGWAEFETEGDFILSVAAPFGLYLLPLFEPDACRLPYDTVTIPLYEEFERQVRLSP